MRQMRATKSGPSGPRHARASERASWPRVLRPCGECGAPATADVVLEVRGIEREVRLCDEHLVALLAGARRVPRSRR